MSGQIISKYLNVVYTLLYISSINKSFCAYILERTSGGQIHSNNLYFIFHQATSLLDKYVVSSFHDFIC